MLRRAFIRERGDGRIVASRHVDDDVERDVVIEVDEDLASGVLKCAVNDYLGYPFDHELHRQAKRWLFDDPIDDDMHESFAFPIVCDMLDLDRDKLMMYLNCMIDQGKRRLVRSGFETMFRACAKT